jgi:hypothetical protein
LKCTKRDLKIEDGVCGHTPAGVFEPAAPKFIEVLTVDTGMGPHGEGRECAEEQGGTPAIRRNSSVTPAVAGVPAEETNLRTVVMPLIRTIPPSEPRRLRSRTRSSSLTPR